MKKRFWLFKRGHTYYVEDSLTHKQESLQTVNRQEAERLRNAKNDAVENPMFSLSLGRAYLSVHDPKLARRIWAEVMADLSTHGCQASQVRCQRAMRSRPFQLIRNKLLIETTADDLLSVLKCGTVSTNNYLRRLHNLAVGLGWLPWPVLPPKLWPPITAESKRAITWEEHLRLISTEANTERRLYYELLWETGASQTDAVSLTAEDVDWRTRTVTYRRHKTGQVACLMIGARLEGILRQLPSQGSLFPYWSTVRDTDRSGEFRRRCRILGINEITLHSYRYAWAERAKVCGYPERFAQQALGHNSKAVHRAYAAKAQVMLPPLEEYERIHQQKVVPFTDVPLSTVGNRGRSVMTA